MNTFKLKHTSDYSSPLDSTTVKTFQAETLDEVFFQFTDFLRGLGYVFDGQVGIVPDAWPEMSDDDKQLILDLNSRN